MLYASEPLTPRQRRDRRWLGAAVLVLAGLAVAWAHGRRQNDLQSWRLEAFEQLAVDDLAAAERAFRRGVGGLAPDALCLLGLSILKDLKSLRDQPPPPPPSGVHLDKRSAAEHARRLLAFGRPQMAADFARKAMIEVGRSDSMTRIEWFANAWLGAVKRAE